MNPKDSTTPARILESARKSLIQKGYKKTSMDLLCRNLGISKKTLYLNYRSKKRLVLDAIGAYVTESIPRMGGLPQQTSAGVYLEMLVQALRGPLARLRAPLRQSLRKYSPETETRLMDHVRQTLRTALGEALSRECRSQASLDVMEHLLLGLLEVPSPSPEPPARVYVDMLLGGLAAPGAEIPAEPEPAPENTPPAAQPEQPGQPPAAAVSGGETVPVPPAPQPAPEKAQPAAARTRERKTAWSPQLDFGF